MGLGLQALDEPGFMEGSCSHGGRPIDLCGYVAPLDVRPYEEEGVVEARLLVERERWA
jgi:hypothetical protein